MLTIKSRAHQCVKRSSSMLSAEKYYWESAIPSMNGEQLLKFVTIHELEMEKLQELEGRFTSVPEEQRIQEAGEVLPLLDDAVIRNRKFRATLFA